MKRILRVTMVAMLLVGMLGSSMQALAADVSTEFNEEVSTAAVATAPPHINPTNGNSFPYTGSGNALVTSSKEWRTIATSTKGFNCYVYIKSMNTSFSGLQVVPSNIRMLGKNGNVLWEESGAIAGQGSRIFICGSDVYTIQIKPQSGTGAAYAYQTSQAPD